MNRSTRFRALIVLCGALLQSCAFYHQTVPSGLMNPDISAEPSANAMLARNIALGEVTLSVSTGATEVTDAALRDALETGLRWKDLLAGDPAAAHFVLDAELHQFACDRPMSGDRTAEAGIRYVLTDRNSGRKFFREVRTRDDEKNYDRPNYGEEFVKYLFVGPDFEKSRRRLQTTREREETAIAYAIRGNITDFIESLAAFPEGYETSFAEQRMGHAGPERLVSTSR